MDGFSRTIPRRTQQELKRAVWKSKKHTKDIDFSFSTSPEPKINHLNGKFNEKEFLKGNNPLGFKTCQHRRIALSYLLFMNPISLSLRHFLCR
jgi:hypothetical protein